MNSSQNSYNNIKTKEKAPRPTRWFFSRIFCFVVALGIWIYVVNITTQDFEKTFSLIDIDVEGWEELLETTNMSIVNQEESKVSITVRGLRSDISKLTEEDFAAYIDVSKLRETGKHRLDVSVDLPSTVSLVSKFPENVTISVGENVEREFDIDIDITQYSIDTSYEMGTPSSDINRIKVSGPSTILDRVKSAKAFINLGSVLTSTEIKAEIVLVDNNGNSIDTTYLTMDNTSVTIIVPVQTQKNIKLVCDFLPGVDQSKYAELKIEPATVRVKGDPQILNELESLTVCTLGDFDKYVILIDFNDVQIPSGVEIINPPSLIRIITSNKAEVSVTEDATQSTEPAEGN